MPLMFNTDLAIYRDYTGDNISNSNLMFNEYSGFYWIWKNYPIKDYVGMNHYRRIYSNFNDLPDIDEIFKKKDIILNKPIPLIVHPGLPKEGTKMTNREWYEYWHNIKDFDLLGEIIKDKYPEYMDGYEAMSKAQYLYPSSMFIMDKQTFLKYCEFIFTILNEFCDRRKCYSSEDYIKYVEEHKDEYIRPYLTYYTVQMQSRIIGYIAERALATFLMHGGEKSLENKTSTRQENQPSKAANSTKSKAKAQKKHHTKKVNKPTAKV
jgi:hypothetical protein